MEHGDKTIKMTLYFWTDQIDGEPAKVAWDYGTVNAKANKSRDISPNQSGVQFTSLDDLPDAVRKCATLHGIKLLKGKPDAGTVKKSPKISVPKNAAKNKSSQERCQVLEDRIFNWSRKTDLNVHKIIALVVRAHGGISRDELVKQVAKFTQARDPYGAVASLLTNRGNAYGRVFAVHDGIIRIHSGVEDLVRQLTWNVG